MSLKNKFISGFSWQALNVLTQVILQLIFIALLARLISPEAFGVMAIALVVVGFIEIFSQIGIGPALIQRKDLEDEHISAAFYISISLGISFTLLLYFLAPWIARLYDHPPLINVLRVIGLSFLISSIAIVPKSLIIKEMAFKKLFIAAFFAMMIGNIFIGLGLAFMGFDLWSYVYALLAQNVIMTIAYWFFHPIKLKASFSKAHALQMIAYGGGSTLFNVFNYAATKIDTLIVGMNKVDATVDLGAEQVGNNTARWENTGLYDRSVYLMSLPITVLGKLSDSVMFSGLAMLQNEPQRLHRAVLSAVYHIALLVIPGSVVLIFFTREFVVLFLGEQYEAAVPIVKILFVSVAFRSLIKIGDAIVRALKTRYLYIASGIKALFFVLVALGTYFGLKFGLTGVAWGLVTAVFIQFIMMGKFSLGILNLHPIRAIKKLVPGIITALLLALFSWGILAVLDAFIKDLLLVRIIIALVLNALLLFLCAWFFPFLFRQGKDNVLQSIAQKMPIAALKKRWVKNS